MTLINFKHANNATALQSGSIGASATSVISATGFGSLFPSAFPFLLTIENFVNATGLVSKREVVKVTNRVGDVFTIVRSAGYCPASSTATTQTNTAFSFTPDADNTVVLSLKATAEDFDDINAELARIVAVELPLKLNLAGGSMTGPLIQAQSSNIASATTTDLSTMTGDSGIITGTATITSFGTVAQGAIRFLTFASTPVVTHNASTLILGNNGSNISPSAGVS